ncbi:hypothetical protein KM043_016826 [Ampulex compressa]|nr:hypothetical protein KM043_016826 [Ampulex compressa]
MFLLMAVTSFAELGNEKRSLRDLDLNPPEFHLHGHLETCVYDILVVTTRIKSLDTMRFQIPREAFSKPPLKYETASSSYYHLCLLLLSNETYQSLIDTLLNASQISSYAHCDLSPAYPLKSQKQIPHPSTDLPRVMAQVHTDYRKSPSPVTFVCPWIPLKIASS